jgi:hypothetical protein
MKSIAPQATSRLSGLPALIAAQLDLLYSANNHRLTLFWAPTEDPEYRPGYSWLELLGERVPQVKRTCRRFCTTFDSLESYTRATDKFQGKPYCCVEVNEAGKLLYFRNHGALDASSFKHKEAA